MAKTAAGRTLAKQQRAVVEAVDSIADHHPPEYLIEVGRATLKMTKRNYGRKGWRLKNRLALLAVVHICERLL